MNNENNNVTGTNLNGNTGIPGVGPIPNNGNVNPTPNPIPNMGSAPEPTPIVNPGATENGVASSPVGSPVPPLNNNPVSDNNINNNVNIPGGTESPLNGATLGNSTPIDMNPNPMPDNNNLNSPTNIGPTSGTFFNSSSLGTDSSNTTNNTLNNPGNTINQQPISNPSPAPAFTNPQAIAGNSAGSMPGFESSNTIGTTPPISFESEGTQKPVKNPKGNSKLPFIIIVLVVLAGVGFGTYYVLNYTNLINKNNNPGISITPKTFEVNLGDELSTEIADYATITGTASSNCQLDTSKVDVTVAGTYDYTVTCGERQETGSITVVDNTELAIELKTVYKTVGDTITANEFAKDPNDGYVYAFLDQTIVTNNLNTAGVHKVTLKVSQNVAGSKETTVEGKLVVLAYPVKGYLTCSSEATPNAANTYTLTTSEQFVIVDKPDLESAFGDLAFEINKFVFNSEEDYQSNKETYKSSGSITIDGKTGEAVFNDDEKSMTLTSEKDNNSLIAEYGADNIQTYRTLYTYFRQTMNYSCTFER